jgi:CDK-activating kinase assembly factor MAT1
MVAAFTSFKSRSLHLTLMSRSNNVGGWLRGKTVRKGGIASTHSHTRSNTPQVQSTSTTIFGGGVKDPSGRTSEFFVRMFTKSLFIRLIFAQSMDDQCPVCKSDRYLNPKLRLLVSSCYHKMYVRVLIMPRCELTAIRDRCESCIDRLFTLGPAPCPICSKVLRKLAFTPQTFEDLAVEKEVAVRRRIGKE